MRARDMSLIGLLVVVLLGMRPTLPQPPSRSAATPAPTADVDTAKAKDSNISHKLPPVWQALCALNPRYGTETYRSMRVSLEAVSETELDPPCLRDLDADAVLPVIAAIADPVQTHLGLLTDRTIEVIEAAASVAGYTPDLHGIPWPVPFSAREQAKVSTEAAAVDPRYPGIVIFRRAQTQKAGPEYIAVLLVPETPTSGLNKQVFFSAVRIMEKLPHSDPSAGGRTVLLLGPNFSGSVNSLTEIATELSERPEAAVGTDTALKLVRCIQAFSGTITNAKLDEQSTSYDCTSKLTNMQTSDEDALLLFKEAMISYGYNESEIALLSEEGTQYGQQHSFLSLHFPRGISSLRDASNLGEDNPSNANVAATGSALAVRLQDAQPDSADDVSSYGGYQTPLSQETVLASLSETLKTQDVKALGILATDPLDITFLIHWFRRSSPNVRLFVRDPDLLYLRTPDVSSINGVLAVSNYPLISENQFWTHEQGSYRSLLTFPSGSQEAQYEAFTELLRSIDSRLFVNKVSKSIEGGWPRGRDAKVPAGQPVWLAAMGTGAYFPINLLVDPSADSLLGARLHLASVDVGKPPYAAILLWLLAASIAAWHAACLLLPSIVPRRCLLEFDLTDGTDAITVTKAICHVVGLLTIALTGLLAGSSFLFFFGSMHRMPLGKFSIPVYMVLAGGVLLAQIPPVVAVIMTTRCAGTILAARYKCKTPLVHEGSINVRQFPVYAGICLVFELVTAAIWLRTFRPLPENAFVHFRDLHVSSGIAPVVPLALFLAAVYLGGWAYLRRVAYWEFGSIAMPSRRLDAVFPSDCNPQIKAIDRGMLQFPPKPWGYVFLVVVAASILAFRPWATLDMVEPSSVRTVTIMWFLFTFFVLWMNWFRLLYMWTELRKMLGMLDKLPLRAAFSRVPRDNALSLWRWSVPGNSFLPTRQAVDTLRALVREDEKAVSYKARQRLLAGIRALASEAKSSAEGNGKPLQAPAAAEVPEILAVDEKKLPSKISRGGFLRRAVGASTGGGYEVVVQPSMLPGPGMRNSSIAGEKHTAAEEVSPPTRALKVVKGPLPPPGYTQKRRNLLHETREAMNVVLDELIMYLSKKYWNNGRVGLDATVAAADHGRRASDDTRLRFQLAEDLVALRYYSYIRYVGTELRKTLLFVVIAFLLLFAAFHTYAFRADQAIDWSFLALLLALGTGVVVVLSQQERDALLSRLQKTEPNELGRNFYFDLVRYGAVPVLTLLGSQVPAISNLLIRWVQPSLQAFR